MTTTSQKTSDGDAHTCTRHALHATTAHTLLLYPPRSDLDPILLRRFLTHMHRAFFLPFMETKLFGKVSISDSNASL